MAAPAEQSGARRALGRDPRMPTRLLCWTEGSGPADAPESAPSLPRDDRTGGFDLSGWVRSSRAGDPSRVAAALFPNHLDDDPTGLDVVELTRVAIGLDGDPLDRRTFTGDTMPTSLRALRTWATDQLDGRGCSTDDVVLALSELSTNVERHAEGWITVDLVETQGAVVVAVTDPSVDRLPVLREVGPEELTGRGLLVVASLSLVWGVVVRARSKTVWAALPCAAAG
jgi:anti-sigma regulatory factor (Ser/Thr protein kinase)